MGLGGCLNLFFTSLIVDFFRPIPSASPADQKPGKDGPPNPELPKKLDCISDRLRGPNAPPNGLGFAGGNILGPPNDGAKA